MRVKLVNDEMEKQPFRKSTRKVNIKETESQDFDLLQLYNLSYASDTANRQMQHINTKGTRTREESKISWRSL